MHYLESTISLLAILIAVLLQKVYFYLEKSTEKTALPKKRRNNERTAQRKEAN